ncbi:MAG: hypothetical protein U0990_09855 [Candidatus Nanopelagicales bacterium]|nr:hypothetical protein [Candidatus Nanopelagicales bacterium]MDZ4250380.1 hypothetical protein [Candidatus Nanopelagicales bacterium]
MFGGEDVPSGADLDGAVAAGSQHELLDTTVDVGVYMAARLAAMYARSTGTRLARYSWMKRTRCAKSIPTSMCASMAVVDELGLEQRVQLVDDQMVDDAVTETGGEDLPLHRLVDHERHTAPRQVGALSQPQLRRATTRISEAPESGPP